MKFCDKNLMEQYNFLFNGEPVCMLTGREFEVQEGKTLKQQVNDFFDDIGNKSPSVFGEILLDNKAFKADSAHGLSREKIAAFKALPAVLKSGIAILPFEEHKKGVKSGMIAAPIGINAKNYVAVAVIRGDKNRLYVHEVTLTKKLLSDSSNPAQQSLQANPVGDIAKVLQNIVAAKFLEENLAKTLQ